MDKIQEYDIDSLAYIDKDYEEGYMKSIVNNLIVEEMKSFKPPKDLYLGKLTSFKHLKAYDSNAPLLLNASASKMSYEEVSSSSGAHGFKKVNVLSKYSQPTSTQAPDGVLAKDLQAWRRVINNAKIQCEYNADHHMNLEIQQQLSCSNNNATGSTVGEVWLSHNDTMENCFGRSYSNLLENNKRSIDEVNHARYIEQTSVNSDMDKLKWRRLNALQKSCVISDSLFQ